MVGMKIKTSEKPEISIFNLPGYMLWYCRRCWGWGAEPSGAACLLCGGEGWKSITNELNQEE